MSDWALAKLGNKNAWAQFASNKLAHLGAFWEQTVGFGVV